MLGYYSKLSSEVYDLDKNVGRSFGDVEYYYDRLASCIGNILEPGVGNGRILIPLLEKGLAIDGIDVSDDMLNLCRRNCEDRGLNPNLWQGEMESIALDTTYEAIIIPTGTFLLLYKREDAIKALKNFYQLLSNGGRLIIDIFLQTEVLLNQVSTRTWECKNGDMITLESKVIDVDYVHQYTTSHHRYEKWRNGELIQTELERFPLRWYGIEEFKMILEKIGFTDIVISADYTYGKEQRQQVT